MENPRLSRAVKSASVPSPLPELLPGKQGVKRGTLLKVRHDGTPLNSQLFFSHLLTGNGWCNCGNCECWDGWTGNACEIWVGAEYWGGEEPGVRDRRPGCPEQPEHHRQPPPSTTSTRGRNVNVDVTLHLLHSLFCCTGYRSSLWKLGGVGVNKT